MNSPSTAVLLEGTLLLLIVMAAVFGFRYGGRSVGPVLPPLAVATVILGAVLLVGIAGYAAFESPWTLWFPFSVVLAATSTFGLAGLAARRRGVPHHDRARSVGDRHAVSLRGVISPNRELVYIAGSFIAAVAMTVYAYVKGFDTVGGSSVGGFGETLALVAFWFYGGTWIVRAGVLFFALAYKATRR